MSPHKESHRNDLHDHFCGINEQEHKIDGLTISCNLIYFLVQSQEEAIDHNDEQDEPIEPRVDGNKLDDLVSEWVGYR